MCCVDGVGSERHLSREGSQHGPLGGFRGFSRANFPAINEKARTGAATFPLSAHLFQQERKTQVDQKKSKFASIPVLIAEHGQQEHRKIMWTNNGEELHAILVCDKPYLPGWTFWKKRPDTELSTFK